MLPTRTRVAHYPMVRTSPRGSANPTGIQMTDPPVSVTVCDSQCVYVPYHRCVPASSVTQQQSGARRGATKPYPWAYTTFARTDVACRTPSLASKHLSRLPKSSLPTARGLNRFRLVIYGRQRTSLPSPVTLHHYSPQAQALHTPSQTNPSRILHLHSHRSY